MAIELNQSKNDFLKSLIWYLSIIIIRPFMPWAVFLRFWTCFVRRQKLITRGQELAQGVLHYTQARKNRRLTGRLCQKWYRDIINRLWRYTGVKKRSQFNLQTASKSFPLSFEAIQLFFSTASLRQSSQRFY